MHLPLIFAALQTVTVSASVGLPTDTLRPQPDSADMATAYHDETVRELVRLARGQRSAIDASVFHYTATSRQRISAGIRALRRDRILYRREGATAIEWWRDRPGTVTVLGAREAIPVVAPGIRVPDGLSGMAREFVPEPGADQLWVNPTDGGFAWHPLMEGGEALYRYATGDTTTIRLPDGRELSIVELRVTPREREFRVVVGSFWIELENHAVVQAVFRPGREFDLQRDLAVIDPGSEDDTDDVPGFLKPIRFDVEYVTLEYGLWELRWWMPRLMAFQGHVQLGAVRMPLSLEVSWTDYTVEADRHGLPYLPPVVLQMAGDPHAKPRVHSQPLRVVIPDDTLSLTESPYLGESFYSAGEALLSEEELRTLGERLDALPPPPWDMSRPVFTSPWTLGQGLMRYNRVEGLSIGARVDWDLSRARVDLTGRLGSADVDPRGELGVVVPGRSRVWRLAGYHRLATTDLVARPLGIGNSLTALLLGRDDGMYFQASGAEILLEPSDGAGRYGLRLYGEHQAAVHRETDASLAHLGGDGGFRENIVADAADQLGLVVSLGIAKGLNPTAARWGAALDLTTETGSYTFVRPGLTVRGTIPLPWSLLGALEVGGGTTLAPDSEDAEGGGNGDGNVVPRQALWALGGPATLRGFAGGEVFGRDYVRSRLEMATALPAARIAIFSDVGWAGRFDDFSDRDIAASVGAGASVLDGLLRVDVARTIQPVERWRLELYIDALF